MSIAGALARMPRAGAVTEGIAEWTSSAAPALTADGLRFVGTGRVDNRVALARELRLSLGGSSTPEADVRCMFAAYERWGGEAPSRLRGDWAFAAWHVAARRLVLARDHFGNTALYYYADADVFAFSTSRPALLSFDVVPVEIDELLLAQHLVSLNTHGESTFHRGVKRLPPAHVLTLTPSDLSVSRYWRLEDTPVDRLPSRESYAVGLRQHLERAVSTRLRDVAIPAVTLSGGLDSGSVVVTAARALRAEDRTLLALSSAPLSRQGTVPVPDGLDADFRHAQLTASAAGNVDLRAVDAAQYGPVTAVRRLVDEIDQPIHGAANAYWLLALLEQARDIGAVLLTGQQGNGGVSWTGSLRSQPLWFQLRSGGRGWLKERAALTLPPEVRRRRRIRRAEGEWMNRSPIALDFMQSTDVARVFADSVPYRRQTALDERMRVLMPERSAVGDMWADLGDALQVEVRDPTADVDLLTFSFSVPDEVFIDRRERLDRWPIREAMKGLLPDEVRLNRGRFLQAPDLVWRLRREFDEVDAALAELEAGRASNYIDVDQMRAVWATVQRDESLATRGLAALVLMRGVMAGLWVNGLTPRRGADPQAWLEQRGAFRPESPQK